MNWVTETAEGVTLSIIVQPRASRTEVVGEHGGALKIRLAAPPVDGAANEELVAFLSGALGVKKSAIAIRSGATGKRKLVSIAGVQEASARALLPPKKRGASE